MILIFGYLGEKRSLFKFGLEVYNVLKVENGDGNFLEILCKSFKGIQVWKLPVSLITLLEIFFVYSYSSAQQLNFSPWVNLTDYRFPLSVFNKSVIL